LYIPLIIAQTASSILWISSLLVMTMNCQGWQFPALGANRPASSTRLIR
jgi:hypothetical protein